MLELMENNGLPGMATTVPMPEEKPKKPLLSILTVILVVLFLLGTVVFGVWKNLNIRKAEIRAVVQKQTEQLSGLEQNLDRVIALYKDTDGGAGENTNAVVLGDSIARENGDRVLGLEDNPAVIKERMLMDKLKDGKTAVRNIRDTNREVLNQYKGMVMIFLPAANPVEKTEKFLIDFERIYSYFEKSADRDIRSTALGFNLGVALQMAVATPDEQSVQRLESVIKDFQNMVTEEKNTDVSLLPEPLIAFHQKVVASDKELIDGVANLPALFRQKDLKGIQENLKTFLTDAVMTGTTGQTDLVSFWQGDTTIRQLPELKKEWQDYLAKL